MGTNAGDQFLVAFARAAARHAARQCDRRPLRRRRVRGRDGHARRNTGRDHDRGHDVVARSRRSGSTEQAVQVGVTVGLAHAPRDGVTRDELMRRADLALRAGKRKHRGGMTVFDPAMDVEFDDRRFIERELKQAPGRQGASTCTTSRSSAPTATASSAPRRWCAGIIRCAARSRRASSSRSPSSRA